MSSSIHHNFVIEDIEAIERFMKALALMAKRKANK